MVKKPNGTWRMCVDYTDLNKTWPKDEYNVFVTPFGVYCYIKVPFGLKNAGSTYQRCVHIVLEGQIGRNVEASIDDIVVKSKSRGDLITDLMETFNNL